MMHLRSRESGPLSQPKSLLLNWLLGNCAFSPVNSARTAQHSSFSCAAPARGRMLGHASIPVGGAGGGGMLTRVLSHPWTLDVSVSHCLQGVAVPGPSADWHISCASLTVMERITSAHVLNLCAPKFCGPFSLAAGLAGSLHDVSGSRVMRLVCRLHSSLHTFSWRLLTQPKTYVLKYSSKKPVAHDVPSGRGWPKLHLTSATVWVVHSPA
mmetsp:Transcript_35452/g.111298  ORF Transcript_35452/g.111298 Transcript_35452/m.111298 type:complete len:211 (-) Transcript_35452:1333-1965(-)